VSSVLRPHQHSIGYTGESCAISQRWPRDGCYVSVLDHSLCRYGHSKLFTDPENPTLEPNMKCIGLPVAEIRQFAYLGVILKPHFGGRGVRKGSAMAPFERAMVVSYRLTIVSVTLSVTIRPQFAIKCLRRSNQQGVGHFGLKFPGVPLGVDPCCLGLQRANIPFPGSLTVKLFGRIPTYVITIHQRYRRTDGQTDRQTICHRKTALCTKVHRMVKIWRVTLWNLGVN